MRADHQLDSAVVGELKHGVNIRVWESGFSIGKDGKQSTGRCKITHPFEGWVSAKCLELQSQLGSQAGSPPRFAQAGSPPRSARLMPGVARSASSPSAELPLLRDQLESALRSGEEERGVEFQRTA